MSVVLFVLGAPGVGKTTLVRSLLGPATQLIKKPKWTYSDHAIAAGHYTGGTFDGADTVPYNGARDALEFWRDHLLPQLDREPTILDGDRFACKSTLEFLEPLPVVVLGVHLVAPAEILADRRAARGSNQNPSWMRGRETKAGNFARQIGAHEISAARSPENVLAHVLRILDGHTCA